jgi:hypothetical protein
MKQKGTERPTGIVMKIVALAVIAATAFFSGSVALAGDEARSTVSSGEAKAILLRMADFMAKARSFSVAVKDSYDVYEETGQKIEFSETRTITIARPDGLRVDRQESNGDKSALLFDGKVITLSNPSHQAYAQIAKPGSIDNAIAYFVTDLGMKLPFSILLQTTAPQELDRRTTTLDYVEKTSIFGAPAHHLAGRGKDIDYQIWVTDGDRPLPQRLVLTYRNEKGQPQFRAQFSDWNLASDMPAAMFAFVPAPEMRQIAFLAQLPRSSMKRAVKPAAQGKVKKSEGQ